MRVTTTDPMTGNDVNDLEHAPYVIEGQGADALKIYFESAASRQEYLEFSSSSADATVKNAYGAVGDNEIMGTIN